MSDRYRDGARALAARVLRAQEDERARVSRDLHDDTGQSLTLLLLRLRMAEEMAHDPALQRELAEIRTLAGETLDGVRRLTVDLGPNVLKELGLGPAIAWLAERMRADTALALDARLDCDCAGIDPDVALAIFRVAQEALTNVVRHARAGRVQLALDRSPERLTVRIADDGVGFRPSALATADAIGLFGMRERVELLGGTLEISSAAGRGTSVTASIPIRVQG